METQRTVADGLGEELWGYDRPGYAPRPGGHPPLPSLCLAPLACCIWGVHCVQLIPFWPGLSLPGPQLCAFGWFGLFPQHP